MIGELFDPNADFDVRERIRPHWSQDGAVVFVTFRTKDSIPKHVLSRWDMEKNEWLLERGLLIDGHWRHSLPELENQILNKFKQHFNRTREDFLDTGQGACLLKNPELAQIVADSLLYFDHDRYFMGDFVVMPNHVHLLASFPSAERMKEQFDSWLHFTAFKINRSTNKNGHFWQQEPFDHLVRSNNQYDYLVEYIAQNPRKSKLKENEYIYRKGLDRGC